MKRRAGPNSMSVLRRALVTLLAMASVGLVAAAPAGAEDAEDPRLTMSITANPSYDVEAGDTVDFTYTVSNDSGVEITPPAGSGVELFFKYEYFSDGPGATNCDFTPLGFADYDDYLVFSWMYLLPAAVQPGESVSCTVAYTATAADVSYGGLWTMLVYEPDADAVPRQWEYGAFYTVPAVGQTDYPTILGSPTVGATLTIDPGLWGPWDPPFTYQWLRDGAVIPGATGASYTPTAADFGKSISVTLTGSTTGAWRTTDPVVISGQQFTDVPPSSPFYAEITWMAEAGISTGYPNGTFRPGASVTRQAMAAFMYRFAGSPAFTPPVTSPFSDVATSSPFYAEVTWMADVGISTGYPNGTFRPAASVTRQAMAAFMYRFAGSPAFTPPVTSPFSDVPTSSPFYAEVTWMADAGISTGYPNGTFRPAANVTRQAMAAFMYRLSEALEA